MSIGIISIRYARALYSLAHDQGQEDEVYNELNCMLVQFLHFPQLHRYLMSPVLKINKKIELLITAAGGENICSVTKGFIEFVVKREKQDIVQFMCVAYQNVYRKAKNILMTKFVSAIEIDNSILDKVRKLIEASYTGNVELDIKVDPNLIGGFVLDIDDNRLDVSVLGELNKIKISFKNKPT